MTVDPPDSTNPGSGDFDPYEQNPYPGRAGGEQPPQYGSPADQAPGYEAQQYGQTPQYGQEQQYGQTPGYGYPAAPPPMPIGPGRPGDLGTRFGARVIDSVILGVVSLVVYLIFGSINLAVDAWVVNYIVTIIASIVVAVIWVGYFVWMESSSGQTLGKKMLGLRTLGPDGANPTTQEAATRNGYVLLGSIASIIFTVIPFFFIGWFISSIISLAVIAFMIVIAVSISDSPTKQGKHDEMAGGTQVVTTK